jgi:hypothetical protein
MTINFDTLSPWATMRRCNLADDGTVLAYWGDANFKDDGSNGQVVVEVSKFYYRTTVNDRGYNWKISDHSFDKSKLHPAFIRNGVVKDKIYIGAYKASIFDTSADSYLLNDEQVADFDADKLCSIAGAKPCSGYTQNLTLPNARKLAQNRGPGWGLVDFLAVSAVNMLLLVELGHFDAQTKIGRGIVDVTDSAGNMAMPTGQTASLGNKSGAATGNVHPVTGQAANSISYRGLEDWWGNIWEWTDGINIRNRVPYVADHDYVSNKFDGHYKPLGITLPSEDGYVADIAVSDDYDWGFLPSEVGASATTKLCDYYYQNIGNRVARRSGNWSNGSNAGPFRWDVSLSASGRSRYYGARLLYVGAINNDYCFFGLG